MQFIDLENLGLSLYERMLLRQCHAVSPRDTLPHGRLRSAADAMIAKGFLTRAEDQQFPRFDGPEEWAPVVFMDAANLAAIKAAQIKAGVW